MARWHGRRGANGPIQDQHGQAERQAGGRRRRNRHRDRLRGSDRYRAMEHAPGRRSGWCLAPRPVRALQRAGGQEAAAHAGTAGHGSAQRATHHRTGHRPGGPVAHDPAELPITHVHGAALARYERPQRVGRRCLPAATARCAQVGPCAAPVTRPFGPMHGTRVPSERDRWPYWRGRRHSTLDMVRAAGRPARARTFRCEREGARSEERRDAPDACL